MKSMITKSPTTILLSLKKAQPHQRMRMAEPQPESEALAMATEQHKKMTMTSFGRSLWIRQTKRARTRWWHAQRSWQRQRKRNWRGCERAGSKGAGVGREHGGNADENAVLVKFCPFTDKLGIFSFFTVASAFRNNASYLYSKMHTVKNIFAKKAEKKTPI